MNEEKTNVTPENEETVSESVVVEDEIKDKETSEECIIIEEPKKKFPVAVIVVIAVIAAIVLGYFLIQPKGTTYSLTELGETANETSITVPAGYYMDEYGSIYTFNEDRYLEQVAAVTLMDCDDETYEEYKQMYIEYGAQEEVLNNFDVLHIEDDSDGDLYDVYLFHKNGCIWVISFRGIEHETQLQFIEGTN